MKNEYGNAENYELIECAKCKKTLGYCNGQTDTLCLLCNSCMDEVFPE